MKVAKFTDTTTSQKECVYKVNFTYYDNVVDLLDDRVDFFSEEPFKFGILKSEPNNNWNCQRKMLQLTYKSDNLIVEDGSHHALGFETFGE